MMRDTAPESERDEANGDRRPTGTGAGAVTIATTPAQTAIQRTRRPNPGMRPAEFLRQYGARAGLPT